MYLFEGKLVSNGLLSEKKVLEQSQQASSSSPIYTNTPPDQSLRWNALEAGHMSGWLPSDTEN